VESALLYTVIFLIRFLPGSWAVRFGGIAGRFAFSVLRVRRKVTLANLAHVFPDMPPAERVAIGRRSYAHLGRSFMELLLMKRIDAAYIDRHVEIRGLEHAVAALEKGLGFIAVTGHFGSWELMAAAFCIKGYPLDVIAAKQKNEGVLKIVNDLRAYHGMRVIPRRSAVKGVARALREKRAVAMLSDQDARGGAGVVVDFFGRPTSVPEGAALFSLKTGAGILCPFIVRQGTGQDHVLFVDPPLEHELTGDRREDVRRIIQHHVHVLEGWIRKHPDHWFWGHMRWKSMGLYD
jgi:KDO2-lipid IV(A) lauroyltransferase